MVAERCKRAVCAQKGVDGSRALRTPNRVAALVSGIPPDREDNQGLLAQTITRRRAIAAKRPWRLILTLDETSSGGASQARPRARHLIDPQLYVCMYSTMMHIFTKQTPPLLAEMISTTPA